MLKKRGKEVPENKDRGAKHAQVRFHIISIIIIIVLLIVFIISFVIIVIFSR